MGGACPQTPLNSFRLIVEFDFSLEKLLKSQGIPSFLESGNPMNGRLEIEFEKFQVEYLDQISITN